MNEISFFYKFDGQLIQEKTPLFGKQEVTVFYEDNQVYEVWVNGYKFDTDLPYERNNPYELAETHLAEGEI